MKRIFAAVLLAASTACIAESQPLSVPSLDPKLDPKGTSVSGISSGGYMAVQLHVAFSTRFPAGAAIIAGGPYECAEGNVLNAIGRCLGNGEVPVDKLVALTREREAKGLVDPVSNLAGAKIFIFNGAKDSVVKPVMAEALAKYYRALAPDAKILVKTDIPADHGFVTDSAGAECTAKATPWLNNCGYDLAGAILAHLYGPLKPKSDKATGQLIKIPTARVAKQFKLAHLEEDSMMYLPKECEGGANVCRLHVALHGCRQNLATVGESFVRDAGFNRWADTNRIVVLYPQTGASAVNGCWDWWGYSGADYSTKESPQMRYMMMHVSGLRATETPVLAPK
jgi:poly(3-hydroxybutyrate) depolymerase